MSSGVATLPAPVTMVSRGAAMDCDQPITVGTTLCKFCARRPGRDAGGA
jgi:hypothetical protein